MGPEETYASEPSVTTCTSDMDAALSELLCPTTMYCAPVYRSELNVSMEVAELETELAPTVLTLSPVAVVSASLNNTLYMVTLKLVVLPEPRNLTVPPLMSAVNVIRLLLPVLISL